MHYRTLNPDEVLKLRRAEEYCFFVTRDDASPDIERKMRPENLRGIFDEQGNLKAGLTNYPFRIHMGGAELAMGGIAGVVSWPEHRREGNVGELLLHILHEEREKGVPLSALYPFKQSFYRQFGWEVCSAHALHEIPTDLLLRWRKSAGVVRRFEPGAADWQVLAQIYRARVAGQYGYIVRDSEAYWADWVNQVWNPGATHFHTAIWQQAPGAEPEGYLLYAFVKDDQGSRLLAIKELVALTPAAEQGLWGFVAQHDSQVKVARYRTTRDYPLWHLVENSGDVKSTVRGNWMLRFVDIRAAFEQRSWHGAPNAAFAIHVSDDRLPWNGGTFRLAFECGQCTLTLSPAETPVLAADQRTWVQLYAGFLRPDQAVACGSLQCFDNRALQALTSALAGKEMWFYEFF